jgi:hypothetical protein
MRIATMTLAILTSSCSYLPFFGNKQVAEPVKAEPPIKQAEACRSIREYVTTLNYLKEKKFTGLDDLKARKVAFDVATHCEDAAERFIDVADVLIKGGLAPVQAISLGVKYAGMSNAHAKAFAEIFQASFAKDMLDMDLLTSLRSAEALTTKESNAEIVKDDFFQLVEFCGKELAQSKPFCLRWVRRVIPWGQPGNGIAAPMKELFVFLTREEDGPRLATGDALKICNTVLRKNPKAGEDFMAAYRHASDKGGLGLGRSAAIKFARELILKSNYKV